MLGKDAFKMMKHGVCIANCARAQLVDQDALLAALESEKVKLYFTDVYYKEPPEEGDALIGHPRVLATPHVGGSTAESSVEGARRAGNQVLQFLADETAVNSVNYSPGDPELKNWETLTEKLGRFLYHYLKGKGAPQKRSRDSWSESVILELVNMGAYGATCSIFLGLYLWYGFPSIPRPLWKSGIVAVAGMVIASGVGSIARRVVSSRRTISLSDVFLGGFTALELTQRQDGRGEPSTPVAEHVDDQ